MTEGPPTNRLRFRWSWRPYQARVLETVDRHLKDDRLHIIAAPGAGKTTLGLEVFRRLGKPALVLAPTLTIRDQWLTRLEDFLPADGGAAHAGLASWTSSDLRSPSFFTVATYQAVLSRSRQDDDAPSSEDVTTLIDALREAGVGTLILDEAHHLKREWWRALEKVVRSLEGLTLVSLTGTPPYDATGLEWRRYEELCGPIDEEISVPELVKAGTLCPHQDFVYAVAPREAEASEIRGHDDAVAFLLEELVGDLRFQREVDAHPWVASESPDLDAVLADPEVAVALLAYLRATGAGLPAALLDGLELSAGELPRLDRRWWHTLLKEYLHGSSFAVDQEYHRELARILRERGLLWRRSLRIATSAPAERTLALSAAKIGACVEIQRAERSVRGEALRLVVLTDYIRDESLALEPRSALEDLGAFPIFDALAAARSEPNVAADRGSSGELGDLAVISGRLAIIHASRSDALRRVLDGSGEVGLSPLPHRDGWMRVEGVKSGALVAAYTRLLEAGTLRVIVGTRSLLGEGWDAPVVNSLILASFVGAYVSTNQMRGRAIRSDPSAPGKVASVWHLVAVAPATPSGFLDFEQLGERFRTFVGLSAEGGVIQSGVDRLRLLPLTKKADLNAFNAESVLRLRRLERVAEGWHDAIDKSGPGQVTPTVSFRSPPTLRPLQLTRTLRYVLYETGLASVLTLGEVLRRLAVDGGSGGAGIALIAAAAIPMAMLAPKLFHAAKLAILHAPVDGSVSQIARALLEALQAVGLVEGTGPRSRTARTPDGGVYVSLEGGTFYDQSLFADAMGEILGPVGNPRYLISRPVTDLFGTRVDYHAVPHVLGLKRDRADAFYEAWIRHVGAGELIYTRREGGRARLLAARGRAFSNQFVDPAERLDRWQ